MSNLLKDNKKLMLEWDYRKNISLNPNTLTIGSNQKVWWICKKVMSGKPRFIQEQVEANAHIVQEKRD